MTDINKQIGRQSMELTIVEIINCEERTLL